MRPTTVRLPLVGRIATCPSVETAPHRSAQRLSPARRLVRISMMPFATSNRTARARARQALEAVMSAGNRWPSYRPA